MIQELPKWFTQKTVVCGTVLGLLVGALQDTHSAKEPVFIANSAPISTAEASDPFAQEVALPPSPAKAPANEQEIKIFRDLFLGLVKRDFDPKVWDLIFDLKEGGSYLSRFTPSESALDKDFYHFQLRVPPSDFRSINMVGAVDLSRQDQGQTFQMLQTFISKDLVFSDGNPDNSPKLSQRELEFLSDRIYINAPRRWNIGNVYVLGGEIKDFDLTGGYTFSRVKRDFRLTHSGSLNVQATESNPPGIRVY